MSSSLFLKLKFLGLFILGIVWCSEPHAENFPSLEADGAEIERIIGGTSAQDGQFPWAVALYFQGNFICTASLISPTTVLTAAHCVIIDDMQRQPNEFYGIVGSADRTSSSATRLLFSSLMAHQQYDTQTLRNDIAFFRLANPVETSNNIKPVCIAKPDTALDNYKDAVAMGWGRTDRFQNTDSDILQYVQQKILGHIFCKARYPDTVQPEQQLCADGFGKGICKGDSGGPLTHVGTGNPVQIGIASFVRSFPGCGSFIFSPGVFTRVSAYAEWIQQNTGDNEICVA